MSTTALIIPTLNAVSRGIWRDVLSAIAQQDCHNLIKIIVDSSSDDDTCAIASEYGFRTLRIAREKFNHGETRDRICQILHKKGIECVVFMSQDVILDNPRSLSILLDYLKNHNISGCYGKQISIHENTLNWWQRQRCYPEKSDIRNSRDLFTDGLRAVFFSNAFAAWKIADVIKHGGFTKTNFGEDTLLAFQILKSGGSIGYCADSIVRHEHSNAFTELFLRGWQIGDFHKKHPEFQKMIWQSKNKTKTLSLSLPISIIFPLIIKVFGYLTGRYPNLVFPGILFCLVWISALPAILLSDVPKPDVAARYAPMAEAFANGNWQFAFHPRVTPLLPCVAGIIAWIFNCTGFVACKLASTLFLSVSVLPLWHTCKKIYGKQTAFIAGLLFASSAYLLRLGYCGLRETGSILGISIIFYSAAILYQNHKKWSGWMIFAIGEVLLFLSRGDMALFAFVAFIALFIFDCIKNHFPVRSVVSGIAILVLLLPVLCYNYVTIGYPVPEVRHAVVMRKIIDKIPFFSFLNNTTPNVEIDIDMQGNGENHE